METMCNDSPLEPTMASCFSATGVVFVYDSVKRLLHATSSFIFSTMDHYVKRFSGEDDDPKMYRRWKTWALNKMAVQDKLQPEARGSYIYTLLDGKALEAVEHLTPDEYHDLGGDTVLWALLDARFPEQEPTDQMGEVLGEVFGLVAADGEKIKEWTGRVKETFAKCRRKVNVDFPAEAQGWVALNCAGMTDERKAVIRGHLQGSVKIEAVATAMRSCYPNYRAPKRRHGILAVEHEVEAFVNEFEDPGSWLPEASDFQDIEAFVAEYSATPPEASDEELYEEHEVAEVLAVTWKEKRLEISKLQSARKFVEADQLKKTFRV